MTRVSITLAVGVMALFSSATAVAQVAKTQTATDTVATVGATAITLAQVDAIAMRQPADGFGTVRLSSALYEARRAAIDELVGDVLIDQEAKAQTIDRTALFDREVSSKVSVPTDAEVTSWYLANQERVQGATLEQAREAIRQFLGQERTAAAREAYLDRLKAKTPVRLMLEPPRQPVRADGGPALGPPGAPIEMIEFADFECPFCQRAHPTVKQLIAAYGSRVRLVYRHFPLQQHPNARPAAEASLCANEQGKFWEYHDKLFGDPTRLSAADLKRSAVDLGLDAERFNACFDSGRVRSVVEADLQAGIAAGVTGTPAFFINGREIVGAPPIDEFKRVIDEELELKKAR
jgi:predicted DsbA family dithiol-disulfide isomerase